MAFFETAASYHPSKEEFEKTIHTSTYATRFVESAADVISFKPNADIRYHYDSILKYLNFKLETFLSPSNDSASADYLFHVAYLHVQQFLRVDSAPQSRSPPVPPRNTLILTTSGRDLIRTLLRYYATTFPRNNSQVRLVGGMSYVHHQWEYFRTCARRNGIVLPSSDNTLPQPPSTSNPRSSVDSKHSAGEAIVDIHIPNHSDEYSVQIHSTDYSSMADPEKDRQEDKVSIASDDLVRAL